MYLDNECHPTLEIKDDGYVLIGIDDNTDKDSTPANCAVHTVYRFDGQMVKAVKVVSTKLVLHYSKFYNLSKFTASTARKVGSLITGNLSCWFKKYDASAYDDVRLLISDKERVSIENFSYNYSLRDKENLKITQFHHLHVRLRDIFANKKSVFLTGYTAMLAKYLDDYNNIEATHATFFIYYLSLPDAERQLFIDILLSYGKIDTAWLKLEGARAKQAQHATKYDLSKLFELNVLENRVATDIDWVKERENREKPKVVNFDYADIYAAAKRMFVTGRQQGKKPMKMKWEDYWMQRAVIMPSGSVHSKYQDDVDLIKKLPIHAKNKKGFASMMPDVIHDHYVNRCPGITAKTSTKYEWGKTRALYGCDITSHIHADFGMMMCEDTLPNYALTGSQATEANVKQEMSSMYGIPLCYDYDDFNSQHSIDGMRAVIHAWISVFSEFILNEQLVSAEWTASSLNDTVVVNNIIKEKYVSKGTLFSGWRLTSFMNTVLNYVYLELSGMNDLVYKSVHNGDDVFASAKSIGHALKVITLAADNGVRAQTSKMNIGTISEFLRMDIKSKNPSSTQYLSRACATFVHSRIELDAPQSLRNLVAAYYARYNELISRGAVGRVARDCYRKQLYFAKCLFELDSEVIKALVTYDLAAGGLVNNGVITNKRIVECRISASSNELDDIKTVIHNGITSYTTYLKTAFPSARDAFSIDAVEKNIITMYNIHRNSAKLEEACVNVLHTEKMMKGAWTNLKGISAVHKMRMGISNIVLAIGQVSEALSSILARSSDPIKWMRILL